MPAPKPPPHLSAEAKRIWGETTVQYGISDGGGLLLLRTALEAFDELAVVRKALVAKGHVVADRFGQPKANPLSSVAHNLRTQIISAIRALRLEPTAILGEDDRG